MPDQRIRIHNGTVVTLGPKPQVHDNGEVIIEGSRITSVGPAGCWQGAAPDRELDARGGLIMPGLVNCHMHLYSTFARGMALDGPAPRNFVDILEGLWWRLDKQLGLDDVEYSALIPLMACARGGTTTIIDHHASPGAVPGSLAAIGKALDRIPLRASLCYEVSDRDGPEVMQAGIAENLAWHEHCASSDQSRSMRHALFGLHAAFTLSEESLSACAAAGQKAGMGFHVHTAEDQADQDENLRRYNKRVVRRLADHGLLGPSTICVHCVQVDDDEISLLAESNTFVAHNPQSNMNNAVGAARLQHMLEKGVRVGLGTDGMTSDMRQEAAAISLLQRQATGDPAVGFMESGTLLLENNPAFASQLFGMPLGVLEPGAAADVAVFDYVPPTPLRADNFLGHFLFGVRYSTARHTVANGQVLLADGALTTIDEAEVAARSRELAAALWQRI